MRVFTRDPEALELLAEASNPESGTPIASVGDLRTALMSIDPAYGSVVAQCLEDFDLSLVVNMAKLPRERETGQLVGAVARRYLDLTPEVIGSIDFDPELDRAINTMATFLSSHSRSTARLGAYDIALNILKRIHEPPRVAREPIYETELAGAATE